jgi:hypothetical protein
MSAGIKATNKTIGNGSGGKPTDSSNPETVDNKNHLFLSVSFQKKLNVETMTSQAPIKNPSGRWPQSGNWDILKAQKVSKISPKEKIMPRIYRLMKFIKPEIEKFSWNYKILK